MADRVYSMREAQLIIDDAVSNPLYHSHTTIYLEGQPGIGKTALCHAVYKKHQRTKDNPKGFNRFVAFVAPEREPTEFGIPMPNAARDAITMMALDEFKYAPSDRVFFLIDEIDKANNMMQNALGRLAHEHGIHNVGLPEGSIVMMAGNRATDRAGGFTANTHIKNRREFIPVHPDPIEWVEDVGIPLGLHPSVTSYIRTDRKALNVFNAQTPNYPSSRSWTKVGELLNTPRPEVVERARIEGNLGVEAANAFYGHLRIYRDLRPIEEIIRNPDNCPLPKGKDEVARMWSEVTGLAHAADSKTAEPIFRYLNRLPKEYGFVGYRDVYARDKMLVVKAKAAQGWLTANADLIIATKGS